MRIHTLLVAPVLFAAAVAAGCSSSSSAPAPSNIFCSAAIAGTSVCYGYKNLNADQQKSVNDACTMSLMGMITTSCPTANLLGCCTSTTSGINTEECYYSSGDGGSTDTSIYQMSCTQNSGTWSTSQ